MTKLILLNKKKRRKKLHEKISFLFNHLEIENFSLLYLYICIMRKICRLTNGSPPSWRRAREGRGYYRCMKSFHFSGVSRDVLCRGYVTRLQNSTAYPRCVSSRVRQRTREEDKGRGRKKVGQSIANFKQWRWCGAEGR